MDILRAVFFFLRGLLLSRSALAAENLALRQQVAVYKRSVKRPKLRPRDRIFWVLLSWLWPNWRSVLAIVQPETVSQRYRQRGTLLGLAIAMPLVPPSSLSRRGSSPR